MIRLLVRASCLLVLAACSSSSGGGSSTRCDTPDEVSECVCSDGSSSVRVCQSSKTLGPCQCTGSSTNGTAGFRVTGSGTTGGSATEGETTAQTTAEPTGEATTEAGTSGGEVKPPVSGACSDEASQAVLALDETMQQGTGCAVDCIAQPVGCTATCLEQMTALTGDCAGCFATLMDCTVTNCGALCISAPFSTACITCREQTGCQDAFQLCGGTGGSETSGGTTGGVDPTGEGTTGGVSQGVYEKGDPCNGLGYEGCCYNDKLVWCESGAIDIVDCAQNLECGWKIGATSFYDCGTNGAAEPTGTHPRVCP
jgi:hypothetical protein